MKRKNRAVIYFFSIRVLQGMWQKSFLSAIELLQHAAHNDLSKLSAHTKFQVFNKYANPFFKSVSRLMSVLNFTVLDKILRKNFIFLFILQVRQSNALQSKLNCFGKQGKHLSKTSQ